MDSMVTGLPPSAPGSCYSHLHSPVPLLVPASPLLSTPEDPPSELFSIQRSPEPASDSENVAKDDFLSKFRHNNRYFEDPNPLIKCFNCGEFGHMASACANPSTKVRCVYCGAFGHTAFYCEEVVCHACKGVTATQVGHKISACPYRRQRLERCRLCDRAGHRSRDCLARQDPIDERQAESLRCLTCGERRHCNCYFVESYSRSLYCCRCGEKGHDREECRDNRTHKTRNVA